MPAGVWHGLKNSNRANRNVIGMSNPASISRTDQALRLIPLTDLTSLNDSDDAASIRALALIARAAAVSPAAVCTWARFIPVALEALRGTRIPVCAVANFPEGTAAPEDAAAETAAAVAAGAAEVDVVFPYRALLSGDSRIGLSLVRLCREAAGEQAKLKVIVETGQLQDTRHIRRAADIAIEGGAQFLKTSTGKLKPGATPEAAEILFDAIESAGRGGRPIGFKASGGIRTIDDAWDYLARYERRFGVGSASPAGFRIGASLLFRDLLGAIE
jgi:deoxyribose-phosphate aldolase